MRIIRIFSCPLWIALVSVIVLASFAVSAKAASTADVSVDFISADSGSWNDPVTWGGGGVPSVNSNVLVKSGHTVTLTADALCKGLYSDTSSSEWAVINGSGNLTIADVLDVEFVSFQTSGTVAIEMREQGRTYVNDCVFSGLTALDVGVRNKTPLNIPMIFERVDFRNFLTTDNVITCTGILGMATAEFAFRDCTFSFDDTGSLLITQRGGVVFENNVVYNFALGSAAGSWASPGHTVQHNFFIYDSDNTSNQYLMFNASDGPSKLYNNYFYLDTANPHPIGVTGGLSTSSDPFIYSKNVFEVVYNTDGANIINTSHLIPVRITNNLLIGSGSLVNNVGDKVMLDCIVKNNTCYGTYNTPNGQLFLAEAGDGTGGDLIVANNIVTGTPGDVRYGIADISVSSLQRVAYSDYNDFFNVDTPYKSVTIDGGLSHDVSIDPMFTDSTRSLLTYDAYVGGTGDKASALSAFLARNGYNSITKKQETGSGRQITDLISWVREGFRPTNAQLQAVGDPLDGSPDMGCFGVSPSAPSVPEGLTGKASSSSQVDISWNASRDDMQVAGYRIYRDGVVVGTSNTTRFSDTGLTASTRYVYRVLAYDEQNAESGLSALLAVETKAAYQTPIASIPGRNYTSVGIGGGGGMISISMSPYSPLWFVGTDMGVIFRSPDEGRSWQIVDQSQAWTTSGTRNAGYFGFLADPDVVFFANEGRYPLRSADTGITWNDVFIPLLATERIKYWYGDSEDSNFILAATTKRLFRSTDKGISWQLCQGISGDSKGTYIDYGTLDHVIYHATEQALYKSDDHGVSFQVYYAPDVLPIHAFAGGRDGAGQVLALVDGDGANACTWVLEYDGKYNELSADKKQLVYSKSGFVYVSQNGGAFAKTSQWGTKFLRMAENDSQTIYLTGDYEYPVRGTQVMRSLDAGANWELVFDQLPNNANGLWPADRLDYSAVGLDVGYWDNSYLHFSVNRRNSSILGGTGFFFLHTSRDKGDHWESPFTKFEDAEPRIQDKRWSSVGLEMTGVYDLKFHPVNTQIGYAAIADIRGAATEDGGRTWRIANMSVGVSPPYNSFYDYAFKPDDDNFVIGAADSMHGWPQSPWGQAYKAAGGVFYSNDRGRTWTRMTPDTSEFNGGFLSVAYDSVHDIIYAGSRSAGVARSTDGGTSWVYINDGLFEGNGRMIPQIEVDPQGNVYALLGGDLRVSMTPSLTNRPYTGIYFLDVVNGATSWQLLRGTVNKPGTASDRYEMWWYPTCFAVDYNNPDTLWLGDYEANAAYLASGVWKSTDRGATWNRSFQSTHVTSVIIDPNDSNKIYTNGLYNHDGSWGEGGAIYSLDGGATWHKNNNVQVRSVMYSQTLDPNDPAKIFYNTWGMGILHGPRPELLPDPSAPSRPSGFTATPISATEVTLSWDASTDNVGVAGYNIYRGSWTGYKVDSTTETTYTVSGLSPNTRYYFEVSAFDAAGNDSGPARKSATTLTGAGIDQTAPGKPSELSGSAVSSTRINLTWTASTDNVGVTGYRVYRDGVATGTTDTNSYADSGLAALTQYRYSVLAYDAAGNESAQSSAVDIITQTVSNTNHAPVVNTLSNQRVDQGEEVRFSVIASDADNDTLSYSASGLPSGASLNASTGLFIWTPGYTQSGDYTVTFSVSDGTASASASCRITVVAVGQAPSLTGSVNSVQSLSGTVPLECTFAASATDADGRVVSYAWDFEGDGVYDWQSRESGAVTYVYKESGVFTPSVKAIDNDGLEMTYPLSVTANPIASSPVIESFTITPSSGTCPFNAQLSVTARSSEEVVVYEWDFDGDGVWDVTTSGSSIDTSYSEPAIYDARVRVTSLSGYQIASSALVYAQGVSNAVELSLAEQNRRTLSSGAVEVTFRVGADSQQELALVEIDFDSDGKSDYTSTSLESSVQYTYTQAGTYTACLSVSLGNGLKKSLSTQVRIAESKVMTPPSISVRVNGSDPDAVRIEGSAPFTAVFRDTTSGSISSVSWDYDGKGGKDAVFSSSDATEYAQYRAQGSSCTYFEPGTFKASVTIENSAGLKSQKVIPIYVSASADSIWLLNIRNNQKLCGNVCTLVARMLGGEKTGTVGLQWSEQGSGVWYDVSTSRFGRDYVGSLDLSQLSNGNYDIRGVYTDGSVSYSPSISVTVDNTEDSPDIREESAANTHQREEKVNRSRSNEVTVCTGSNRISTVIVPGAALDNGSDRLNVKYEDVGSLVTRSEIDEYWDYTLESGQREFSEPVTLRIGYVDADNDGVVDGSGISERELEVYYYNTSNNSWDLVPGCVVHALDNFVEVDVNHFTLFGLGVEPADTEAGSSGDTGSSTDGGGCFIAAATYGTEF